MIKEELKDKYIFEEEYSEPKILNFDNMVLDVYNGKYNLIVGSFYKLSWRENKVNYVHPLYFNSNTIVHINKKKYNSFIKIFYQVFKPILLLIGLGLIFGIILHIIEPYRTSYLYPVQQLKKQKIDVRFRRTILTTISSFFGEMGFLSENSSLGVFGIIIVIFIMVIGYIIISITEARLTYISIQANTYDDEINIDKLHEYKIIGLEGDATSKKIENKGVKMDYVSDKTNTELIEYYLKNQDKYDGFAISYADIFLDIKKYKNLSITYDGLGLNTCSWIINQNNYNLLNDINIEILKLRDNKNLTNFVKNL